MVGSLYERPMPPLPNADEPHVVPSGYWKVVAVQDGSGPATIRVAAFLFDQDTPSSDQPLDHVVAVDEVERRSGLDLLRLLPDEIEAVVEAAADPEQARALLFPGN